jgi:hypothetical protein
VEAINGAYSVLQTVYGPASHIWGEERSDNTTFQHNPSDRGKFDFEQFDEFLLTSGNDRLLDIWNNMYKAIAQSNQIIDEIDNLKSTTQKFKNGILGQAEFIRALMYFNLVRLWGGVPLIIHPIKSPDEAFSKAKRASADSVYNQIINDAKDASNKLPASWPSDQEGRATKGAALTLLMDVYMTQKDFSSAIKQFPKIKKLGYSLVSNYASLYNPSTQANTESIFRVQYSSAVDGEASNYIYIYAPYNSGTTLVNGFKDFSKPAAGRNIPTKNIVRAYEKGDKRYEASIGWYVNPDNTKWPGIAFSDSIPYVKKFAAPPTQPSEQDVDFNVYRYAQVLLWEAEALNETGKTGQAYQYINKVRRQAGLSNISGLSQTAFRKAVYHEERVENAFEYFRWFQLLRTGRALQVMKQQGQRRIKNTPWLKGQDAYQIEPFKFLLPIPTHLIQLSHLKQNPGW